MAVLLMMSLATADRERYGGPEWFALDEGALNDMPAGDLEQWENELLAHGMTIASTLSEFDRLASVRSSRAMLWLGLRQAGVVVAYTAFDPKVFAARYQPPAGDVDPPAQTLDSSCLQEDPAPPAGSPSADT